MSKEQIKPKNESYAVFRLKADGGGYAVMKIQIGVSDNKVQSNIEIHPSDTLAIASAILIQHVRKDLGL